MSSVYFAVFVYVYVVEYVSVSVSVYLNLDAYAYVYACVHVNVYDSVHAYMCDDVFCVYDDDVWWVGGWVGGGGVCVCEVGARFFCFRAVTEAAGKEMERPPSATSEKSMFVGSGERMVARLKLKEIDSLVESFDWLIPFLCVKTEMKRKREMKMKRDRDEERQR